MRAPIDVNNILGNNRFAALAAPSPNKPAKRRRLYEVDIGEDVVTYDTTPLAQSAPEWNHTSTAYFGVCHNCGHRTHAQIRCPLKRCGRCRRFGHTAEAQCPADGACARRATPGGGARTEDTGDAAQCTTPGKSWHPSQGTTPRDT